VGIRASVSLSGTVQFSNFAILNASATNIVCPTNYISLGAATCTAPCDPLYTNLAGKIRVFFPAPIPAGTATPVITSVSGILNAASFKFCISADAGVNVERFYADYCVYSNLPNTLPVTGPLSLTFQTGSLPAVGPCTVQLSTVLPPCISGYTSLGAGGGVNGGAGNAACPATITCNSNPSIPAGTILTFSSQMRIYLATCLPAGTPLPTITGLDRLDVNGNVLARYCLVASAVSTQNMGQPICYADYCIYSTLAGDTYYLNPPATLSFTIQAMLGNPPALMSIVCSGPLLLDNDKDGIPDAIDVDDDNDGIPDRYEFATGKNAGFTPATDPSADDDGDATPNYRDADNTQCGGLNAAGICTNYDTDGDGIPNHFDLDSDNDGLPDVIEAGGADGNGDGRVDCTGTCDADGDGLLAPVDINDASTATYAASTNISKLAIAPNTFVFGNSFYNGVLDTDGDTVPDFLDIDSDNDGIYDIIETGGTDATGDGRVDYTGSFTTVDADMDGLADVLDADTNNDGDVTDAGEGTQKALIISVNATGDGTAETWTDGPNPDRFPVDFDSDILPNYRDLESDSDGINDVTEAGGADPDGNGIIGIGASNTISVNNDGYATALTAPLISTDADSDGDGRPNDDADPELSPYYNGGGALPYGGTSTSPLNFRPDQDSDTRPNFLDLDSDNDAINDIIENIGGATTYDTNNDGMIDDRSDPDYDGIGVPVDGDLAGYGDATNALPVNSDGDAVPDYLDLDSDNDGLFDVSEGGTGGTDANGDGIVDCTIPGAFASCDPDLDGILAVVDGLPAVIGDAPMAGQPNTPTNSDTGPCADALPDYRDVDSQNQCNGANQDIDNTPYPDANNDGMIDGTDTDYDGIINPGGFPDDNQVFGGNTGMGSALPVTLVDFKARSENQVVRVTWTTSQEINLRNFEVMRSTDGINFVSIGSANAIGGIAGAVYQFVDVSPVAGNNFYYLIMIDADSKMKMSNTLLVKMGDKNSFLITVSPNPVRDQFIIRMAGMDKGQYRIELFNSVGQLQGTKKIILTDDNHVEYMDRGNAGPGIYRINIVSEKTNRSVKNIPVFYE
jgi:hypothetical protein